MNEDKTPAELFALADQAEAVARGLLTKAFDLRVEARNKQRRSLQWDISMAWCMDCDRDVQCLACHNRQTHGGKS